MFTFMFTSVSTLSIFPTSACSLASLLSRIFSIYRFLTFLALASRLLLILGFDMEFFHSPRYHTGSDSCLSFPLSLSVFSVSLRRFPPAPLYFVVVAWCRCSPLSLSLFFSPFFVPYTLCSFLCFPFLSMHFHFFFTTPVTFMHANYYPVSYI